MNIVVVGLGSMGKRRIRLIRQYDSSICIFGVDTNMKRAEDVMLEYGIKVFSSVKSVCNSNIIDAAFVCTSPLSHKSIISELISYSINVFTEINLVKDGYDEFITSKNVKLFLSSTFLYRKDIQWIIENVRDKRVNYLYHTGQYLPDWHPWENYKNFFVNDKRTNGCREILAIELPWILKCFGEIKSINVLKDNISSLAVDYPDNYLLQIQHKNGNKGQIAVDIVSRIAVRKLNVFNDRLDISWDGTPNSLKIVDLEDKRTVYIKTYDSIKKDSRYCDNIIENAYMDEIDSFFSLLNGDNSKVFHDFENDLKVLNLIDEIEA